MSRVAAQYEAYPYPERDPRDEAKRLITGSPSHPLEIDHYLFAGARDWSRPLRALIAGGGTGDALIQLAAVLAAAKRPYRITYLDLSARAREIAEARAAARGLGQIEFVTGSLLDAQDYGPFDYIDCCGVLHHLPEPQAGFDALARALHPEGGMGLMVYAPYGRSGVYPLQRAFARLLNGTPEERLAQAKLIMQTLPANHPFLRNTQVVDHQQSDSGFYDLLLHTQDTPFRIEELLETLERAGLVMTGTPQMALYDPAPFVADARLLDPLTETQRMGLGEALSGTLRKHVLYAAPASSATARVARARPGAVPHFKGLPGTKLARAVARNNRLTGKNDAGRFEIAIAPGLLPAIALVDGRRTLGEIAAATGQDWIAFAAQWDKLERAMTAQGLLFYSTLKRAGAAR